MAVQTSFSWNYAWRPLVFGVLCLILGLWGVYDYVVAIPAKHRLYERSQICELVNSALAENGWSEFAQPARESVTAAINEIFDEHLSESKLSDLAPQELRGLDDEALAAKTAEFEAAIASIRERDEEPWLAALVLFDQALRAGEPAFYPLTGIHLLAHDVANSGIEASAGVSRPNPWDRPTQWAFILCLPFVPWAAWLIYGAYSRRYRLEEDGTLSMPDGQWHIDDIVAIDMDRWMSKSIAVIEHSDGRKASLDDYKHRDLHLIVGAIASKLHPDKWDAEAKQVKAPATDDGVAEPVAERA